MAFTFVTLAYIVALIADALLIFLSIFHIIAFEELRTDFKNPIEQCDLLNPLVLPEYLIHFVPSVLFVLSGEWVTVLISLPLMVFHIRQYLRRPVMSCAGIYDPTEIMRADVLNAHQSQAWAKLAFYVLSLFYFIYGMIYSLIA